jgi:hypothetical protein
MTEGVARDESATIPVDLPVLAHHVEQYPCKPASVVLVTHVLDTAVRFVELVASTADIARRAVRLYVRADCDDIRPQLVVAG